MRVRRQSCSVSHVQDKSQSFIFSRVLFYMDRFLKRYPRPDHEILGTLHWLLGPDIVEKDLPPLVSMLNLGEAKRGHENEIDDEIRHARGFGHLVESAFRKTDKRRQLAVIDLFRHLIEKRLKQLHYRGKSDIEKNLAIFRRMFDLNDVETEICLFLFILSAYEEVQSLFEYHLKCHLFQGRNCLAIVLGSRNPEISEALNGKLAKIGILDSDRNCGLHMDYGFVNLLQDASDVEIRTEFFRKIDPDPVPIDAHTVNPQAVEHILKLFKEKPSSSTHVVFYGPPGTGKTSLAYGIGKKLGLPIYLVEHGGKEKSWKRQAAFTACVNMLGQGEGALVIADDADNILNTSHPWFFLSETPDKRWLHDILETPGVRMIWTVNSITNLEESVARRFSYSLAFKPFSRVQRKHIWETILRDYHVDAYFGSPYMDELAGRFEVSAGVIKQAVKKAAEMGSNSRADIHKAIILSLEAHQSLVHGGRKPVSPGKIDLGTFSLDGLNVSGADLGSLMKELKAFNHYLKHSDSDKPISQSLLFHGVSGSGKSFLARYIAHRVDREIIVKRGSDLLSPWVGETEHNIRGAFEEAEAKEAVLVFDEADFLLGNRERAAHSWEISQVNEFLTAMEQFRGIQIYTTNLLTHLDAATLRRFSHKLEFGYLRSDGVLIFYKKMLLPLIGSDLEKGSEDELRRLHRLTPGDFKVVKSKFQFKRSNLSHRTLIEALKEEAKIKEIHRGKNAIGF
jgi:transitional endoplasmic reticulum ATPase